MSTLSVPRTAWQWPADVLAFAAQHQVQATLDPLLEATRQVFPTARSVRLFLELDPEIRDDRHIVFEVQVPHQILPSYSRPRISGRTSCIGCVRRRWFACSDSLSFRWDHEPARIPGGGRRMGVLAPPASLAWS
jgi:hypothetical protein